VKRKAIFTDTIQTQVPQSSQTAAGGGGTNPRQIQKPKEKERKTEMDLKSLSNPL
jgi:hypothetical protein